MQKDIHEIKQKVDQVFNALLGNQLTQDGGLVGRIMDLEKENSDLRKKIEDIESKGAKSDIKMNIIWAVGGVLAAALLKFFMDYITNK